MPDGDEARRNDAIGLTHVHHFFTKRNLRALAAVWRLADEPRSRFLLTSLMYKSSVLCSPLMSNYFAEKAGNSRGGWVGKERSGTLYFPSIHSEVPVHLQIMSRRSAVTVSARSNSLPLITTSSAGTIDIPDDSVDYIFTDPPFGSNRMYSDLNFIWESWLRLWTSRGTEAIESRAQGKGLREYEALMLAGFREYYRVLKPGRWITVEFSNTRAAVWNVLQTALMTAGFVVADVRGLDKKQGSIAGYTTSTAVRQDLAISAYRPRQSFIERFEREAGTEEGAWEFVRQHLENLPVFVELGGRGQTVAERQNYLLYDRMIAYHIQRGATIPLSAAQFYAGLKQRFPERDGMYFLPHQVAEYDQRRLEVGDVEQLSMFVNDEQSTIQWLRQELGREKQTYQRLHPKFLRELHQAAYEQLPELSEVLEQNFLRDESDRWYIPDPAKASDLEKLRERDLLTEFAVYESGRGKLKSFRTEAIRAGFRVAWRNREFERIVRVANRLPEVVVQEDPQLLMYYDQASDRVGG